MRLLPHDPALGWTPYAWLIYIIPFAVTPVVSTRQNTPGAWAMYIVTSLLFCGLYFRSYWAGERELTLVAALTAALGLAFWPISYGAGAFFIYAGAMLGQLPTVRKAVIGVGAVALLVPIEAVLLERGWFNTSWPFVFTLLVGGINIHFCQVSRSNARLRLAHDEIEHLAKVAERERIARDLHDLLGHTLSLVVLKSELASKLADRDPERAREEIRDVERIARDALAEVRSAVRGYRAGGFATEVAHAEKTLHTAGSEVVTSIARAQLPASHEAVLSLALREAVTNIVRHAGARRCRITLDVTSDSCRLMVIDDGRGGNEPFGNGLTGMRERVEVLGGTMTRDGHGGTTLVVTLPLQVASLGERSA